MKVFSLDEMIKAKKVFVKRKAYYREDPRIANPEKPHPFVGKEKPVPALSSRAYPDEAAQKTAERAIKEVGGEEYQISEKDAAKTNQIVKVQMRAMEILRQQGGMMTMLEATEQAKKELKDEFKGESTMKKTLWIGPIQLEKNVDNEEEQLEKAAPPGLTGKKVPVKGKTKMYQATRYTQTGQPMKGPQDGAKPPPGGQPQEAPPGPSSFDQPAKEGDRIMIEGRHAIVTTSGEHGVTAHDAEGNKYQKFHGDYEHFGKKGEAEEGAAQFDFGEKKDGKPAEPSGEHEHNIRWNLAREEKGMKPFFTSKAEKDAYLAHKNGGKPPEDKAPEEKAKEEKAKEEKAKEDKAKEDKAPEDKGEQGNKSWERFTQKAKEKKAKEIHRRPPIQIEAPGSLKTKIKKSLRPAPDSLFVLEDW
jgi:hypothetical protein